MEHNTVETTVPSSTDIRQQAIDLIEQLPPTKLGEVIAFLESLSQSSSESEFNPDETALISLIQRPLPSEIQQRLDELRERCELEELTPEEHQELLSYEDLREQQNVERLEALIKLAVLRKTDLATLNRQF